MRAVARAKDRLVAVGDSIWTSANGISWKSMTGATLATPELRALIGTTGGLLAVGGDRGGGSAALVSQDGAAWTRAPDQDPLATADLLGVGSDGTVVLAVGVVRVPGTGGAVRITPP
jgi:hypothetical protein